MKKSAVLLSLIIFLATANFAGAKGSDDKHHGRKVEGWVMSELRSELKNSNKFVVMGTVKSATATSLVITSNHKMSNVPAGDVTVTLNAKTDYQISGKDGSAADIKVGSLVLVIGESANNSRVAEKVIVKGEPAKHEKKKVSGEVTAKTDTSITIKNNVTGATTTVPVNEDTKVRVNGETKAMTDVQVGDKGFVKVKNVLGTAVAKFVNLFR